MRSAPSDRQAAGAAWPSCPADLRCGALFNSKNPNSQPELAATQVAANTLGARLLRFEGWDPNSPETACAAKKNNRVRALMVFTDPALYSQRDLIVDLAAKNQILGIYPLAEYAQAGGLMSYGSDSTEFFRRAATYVDKTLKGAKAGDLPIEHPTKFELVINGKTAKALGLKIPESLLISADKVTEKAANVCFGLKRPAATGEKLPSHHDLSPRHV